MRRLIRQINPQTLGERNRKAVINVIAPVVGKRNAEYATLHPAVLKKWGSYPDEAVHALDKALGGLSNQTVSRALRAITMSNPLARCRNPNRGTPMKVPSIYSPVYTTPVNVKGQKGATLLSASVSGSNAVRIFARLAPELTKEKHKAFAAAHTKAETLKRKKWGVEADRASRATFGRPFYTSDYRVSGIGRSEFSEAAKNRLRKLAHEASAHGKLAYLHAYVSKHMRRKA